MGGRTVSSAFNTEIIKTVTSVGYLIDVNFPTASDLKWSNIGAVTWNSVNWLDRDFEVSGLNFDVDDELSCTITIPNLIKAGETYPSAIFMGSDKLYETPVTIYQFARGALAVADVPKMAYMVINGAKITIDKVVLSLGEYKIQGGFSPYRKINNAFGFKFCQPPGTKIIWGNEILTVEERDSG